MIGRLQSDRIKRNERQQAADRAAAEREEERRRIREFTCLALPTLLESIGMERRHAAELRKQGWVDVESMKCAVIADFVACGLDGYEARRLLNAVKAITDPRRLLNGGKYTKPAPSDDPVGHSHQTPDEDDVIRVSNIADLTKAALSGGTAAVSRREAERQLTTGTSKFEVDLQSNLAARAEGARRRRELEDKNVAQLERLSNIGDHKQRPQKQIEPTSHKPSAVKEVLHSYGWAPGVSSVVRTVAHRLAWKWSVAHPPDRVLRSQWCDAMLKLGRLPADELRTGQWSSTATATYEKWLLKEPSCDDNGCERISLDTAVVEQGERIVAGLRLIATARRHAGRAANTSRPDCPLSFYALELAHQTLTEAGRQQEVQTIDEALSQCRKDMDDLTDLGRSHLLQFQKLSNQRKRLEARRQELQEMVREVVPTIPGVYSISIEVDQERRTKARQEIARRAAAIRREEAQKRERVTLHHPPLESEPEPELEYQSEVSASTNSQALRNIRQSRSSLEAPCGGGKVEADRHYVISLLTAAFKLRESHMRRVLTAWVTRSRALRSSVRRLNVIFKRMARARVERCFLWWAEIWSAGEKGRARRNRLLQRKDQPSEEALKRQRERQWKHWDRKAQELEERRKVRKEAEWRAAKRERLLSTRRAQTAELGAIRQRAVEWSEKQQDQVSTDWAGKLKKLEETHAATKEIEVRERLNLKAREAARKAEREAKAAQSRLKQEQLEQLVEDTYIWLRVVTTPQQNARRQTETGFSGNPQSAQLYRKERLEQLQSKRILNKQKQRTLEYRQRRQRVDKLREDRAHYRQLLAAEDMEVHERLNKSSRTREQEWMTGQAKHIALVRAASR